ncbi:MAG: thymidine phosphorylase [Metamycoplasmataceae bacterium]
MNVIEIINKKRRKEKLSFDEINFFIKEYILGNIQDYQMSALLMAIAINGMDDQETAFLTDIMLHSGRTIDLSNINGIKLDKHSTGGVGDKTSLVIGPILASLGANVAKMSGRGLGYTGGTLDKLESIKGFNVNLSEKEFKKIIIKDGLSIISQSDELVPADKKLYALRDVSGTVESIPLIASSIMSKKLATGSDAILLDIKCGTGAFMKNKEEAIKLGNLMVQIGNHLKKDIKVEITNMNEPLGKMIGNKNEIIEVIDFLQNSKQKDKNFEKLILSSCTTMLKQAKISNDKQKSLQMIKEVLENGKALESFYKFIQNQGGDLNYLKSKEFWMPKYKYEILANNDGYLNIKNSFIIGNVAAKLGAGRFTKNDQIDFDAGIELKFKTGDKIKKNDVVLILYSSVKEITSALIEEIKTSYEIIEQKMNNEIILKTF